MPKKRARKLKKQPHTIYGETALLAVELMAAQPGLTPVIAWKQAARQMIKSTASRIKHCPFLSFVGLCEAGLIVGVTDHGTLAKDSLNVVYVKEAIRLLQEKPELQANIKDLWLAVMSALGADPRKRQNDQMGIVCALWSKGLIVRPSLTKPHE